MKVNILNKSGNELKIEIVGSSHGLCNLLTKRLLEDKSVDFAGYDIAHPLASNPTVYVRMKGKADPQDALIKAISKIRDSNDAFSKELDRVLNA